MFEANENEKVTALAEELEADMLALYGPTLFGKNLFMSLGYATYEAFRQAVIRKTVPVVVFPLEKRRGKFALTKDVAFWLAKQRVENS